VETLQRVGIARMLQVAHAAGITTMYRADRYGPALTLGGGDVTLLDLTAAYGTIAAGGMRHAPRAILSVTDAQATPSLKAGTDGLARPSGRVHELGNWAPPPAVQAFGPRSPQLAALMTDILSDDSARLPAFGANSLLVLPGRPAAVKTGTTSDWHDNWTIGYTPDLVVGVWVGNADNAPMVDISGITGAAPIWHDVVTAALRGVAPRPFALPPGMVRETVCQDTGLPALPSCRDPMSELFIAGTQPSLEGVHDAGRMQYAPTSGPQPIAAGPVIADPPDGAQFALSSAIPVAVQRIAVSISSQMPVAGSQKQGERYELLVDGRPAGGCAPASSPVPQDWGTGAQSLTCTVLWTLRPGRHRLEACDCGRMAADGHCGARTTTAAVPACGQSGAVLPRPRSQVQIGRRLRAIWITVVQADG
jgi:membrane peptidoglycan carboxypeptidase